jgi:iron complex outermembrane receptor protein
MDGHRINDPVYSAEGIDFDSSVSVDMIERIEVVRGPGSSLYGSNAFFGVVNIITKSGQDIQGTEASVYVGEYDSYEGRVVYGDQYQNGFEFLAGGSVYRSDGVDRLYFAEFDDPATNNGVAEGVDGRENARLYAKLSYLNFELLASYVSREKQIPTASYGTVFNEPGTYTIDDRFIFAGSYIHDLSSTTSLTARLNYSGYDYDGQYTYDYADPGDPPDLSRFQDNAQQRWVGSEVVLTKRFNRNSLTAGVDYRNNFQQDQHAYDEFDVYLDDKRSSSEHAVYIQDEFIATDRLRLTGGVRYDDYDDFGSQVNPRVAAVYSLRESAAGPTVLKLSYGEAFRAPNGYELYYSDGGATQKASDRLEPETIKTFEIGLEHYFRSNLMGAVTAYQYEIDDLIDLTLDPDDDLLVFDNIGQVEAQGFEASLEGSVGERVSGRLSYTYADTKDKATNTTLTNSPEHLAKANLIVPIFAERLTAGFELQYISRRITLAGNYASSSMPVNLTLASAGIVPGLSVSASLLNVFDDTVGFPGSAEHVQDILFDPGRTYRANLNYKF